MLTLLASLTMALAIDGAQPATPSRSDADLSVTVRIHDYAHVPGDLLSRASDQVTRLYETIGVHTTWYDVLQFPLKRARSRGEDANLPLAQLTINILTPEMASRRPIQADVLGFAVVPQDGMGRIAYVIYDRVHRVAAGAAASDVDLLGFVLAHEIGHLLGLRSPDGLLKCHWDRLEVRQMNVRNVEIQPFEAQRIRSTIEQDSATALAAARAGARPPERR